LRVVSCSVIFLTDERAAAHTLCFFSEQDSILSELREVYILQGRIITSCMHSSLSILQVVSDLTDIRRGVEGLELWKKTSQKSSSAFFILFFRA
jgi:hypothetical protein